MNFAAINWLAVAVCVVVSMVSGSLWYNPKTFFPAWWKVVGKADTPGLQGNMGLTWALTVLSSLVQAVFMALLVNAMGSMTAGGPTLVSGATGRVHSLARLCGAHLPGQQTVRRARLEDLGDRSRQPSGQFRALWGSFGSLALGLPIVPG